MLTEGFTVDSESAKLRPLNPVFGVIRTKDTLPIEITIRDDPGRLRPRTSDAVFGQ
jgi:hypothetical protein